MTSSNIITEKAPDEKLSGLAHEYYVKHFIMWVNS
jgi:hypothetical protein